MKRSGHGFYVLIRVKKWVLALAGVVFTAMLAATVRAAAAPAVGAPAEGAPAEGVPLPVVMYHAVLKDESRHGQYVVSPDELESDLKYLKDHGYTTIFVEDLIAYTKGGDLPEKPVLITFDDGYYNNYVYAYQIAKELDCKIVISPIVSWADYYTDTGEENAYYTHATWPRLKEMTGSGVVELQNHSYDLHKTGKGRTGAKRLKGESLEAYTAFLTADLEKAQQAFLEHTGKAPAAFVYPFGAYNQSTAQIVKDMGFAATFTCEEKICRVTRDPESLYGLGRFLRPSGISSEDFFKKRMKLS